MGCDRMPSVTLLIAMHFAVGAALVLVPEVALFNEWLDYGNTAIYAFGALPGLPCPSFIFLSRS